MLKSAKICRKLQDSDVEFVSDWLVPDGCAHLQAVSRVPCIRAEHQTKPEVLNPHFLCAHAVKMMSFGIEILKSVKKKVVNKII